MTTHTITFETISVKATKRFKVNGKWKQVTKRFEQTVNPFNKNPDGTVKTREQIWAEVRAERNAWEKQEVV